MKEKLSLIAAILLGALFVVFGANFFLRFIDIPRPEAGSPPAQFMGVLFTTGFLTFVKILEIAGGVLVAIPKTRRLGMLILTPIVVNILAYAVFITGGEGLLAPPVIAVAVLSGCVLYSEKSFLRGLLA